MKITREETLPTEVILSIQLDDDDVEPYLDWAYRRLVNKIRVQGFRMGKAPRAVLESVVGRERLLSEALERAVSGSVDQAVKEESLQPFAQPDVNVTAFDPLSIKAVIPLEPQVSLGDYRSIRIARAPVFVGDEQVEQVLERLQVESAPWEPADRPIRFGDQVTIDVVGTVEGRPLLDEKAVEYLPAIDNSVPLPGFSVMLEGAAKQESKTFTLKAPDDYGDPSIAGKECRFQVLVHEVKERILPDLDDEFAKGVGDGFDTLEALRESIMENLTATAEREADQDLREKALDQLMAGAEVEFPDMLVERQLDNIWHERTHALQSRRMEMEEYLRQVGKSEEELKEEMRPETRQSLIRSFTLNKLAEEQDIAVTPEDVDAEIDAMLANSGAVDKSTRETLASDRFRGSVRSTLMTRRTLERLASIVQGQEKDADAADSAGQDPNGEPHLGGTESDNQP